MLFRSRDALKTVVDVFNDVLPAKHGSEALAALKNRFGAMAEKDENVPCRAALDSVQAFEKQAQPGQIDKSLRTYADFVNREYQLAVKHSQRK